MSRTIAITGATGFAGGHVLAALLARGHRVKALVRNLAAARLPDGVQQVQGDVLNADALEQLLKGADAVVHLAGVLSALTPHEYFRINAHGTVAMAEAAARAGTGRFVHVSSLAAREPALSPYGASKRAGEDAISKLSAALNAVIIRPPAVYGPGDRGTLPLIKELTRPIAAIPGSADARFSLIHGADLARIIVAAIEGGETGIHEVSDGRDGGYAWPDLIRIAEEHRGGRIRPVFLPRAVPQGVALAAEALARFTGKPGMVNRGKVRELYHRDWVCRTGTLAVDQPITFAQGFPETLAWYREAGWLPHRSGTDRTGRESPKDIKRP
jgi:nucleoside-diphosphate-sugar epimerase